MAAPKNVTALAPLAIEPMNFKTGDTVRKFYNGRDLTPYVGTVVRIDTACNKVDVNWPMGAAREAPEELVRESTELVPPYFYGNVTSEQKMVARVANAHMLGKSELEEAATTLLMAGYNEAETVNLLVDGTRGELTTGNAQSVLDSIKLNTMSGIPIAYLNFLAQ